MYWNAHPLPIPVGILFHGAIQDGSCNELKQNKQKGSPLTTSSIDFKGSFDVNYLKLAFVAALILMCKPFSTNVFVLMLVIQMAKFCCHIYKMH